MTINIGDTIRVTDNSTSIVEVGATGLVRDIEPLGETSTLFRVEMNGDDTFNQWFKADQIEVSQVGDVTVAMRIDEAATLAEDKGLDSLAAFLTAMVVGFAVNEEVRPVIRKLVGG